MSRRKKTDGERIAVRWCEQAYRAAAAKDIDRIIRRRMAEAWEQGFQELDWYQNPYRKRRKK